MLTAPWIILSYNNPKKQNRKGFVIFYRKPGNSVDEFLYLIDYLMHYQVLIEDTDIFLKTLDAHPSAAAYFGKAKDQYVEEYDGGTNIRDMLNSIQFMQMNSVRTQFSELQLGME